MNSTKFTGSFFTHNFTKKLHDTCVSCNIYVSIMVLEETSYKKGGVYFVTDASSVLDVTRD